MSASEVRDKKRPGYIIYDQSNLYYFRWMANLTFKSGMDSYVAELVQCTCQHGILRSGFRNPESQAPQLKFI